MASLDDLQVDMAGCLVGVFAVLWLTKTGLPQEEPGRELVDLEVRVAAAEKFIWLDEGPLPSEKIYIGHDGQSHVSPSPTELAKRQLLGSLQHKWEGLDATSSQTPSPVFAAKPLSSATGVKRSIDDDVIVLPSHGNQSLKPLYYWEADSRFTTAFRATFDPSQLQSESIGLQVTNPAGHPVVVDGKYLYRLLPRWEVIVGGRHIEPAPDFGRATIEDLARSMLPVRQYAASRCDRQQYAIALDQMGTRFLLTIQDNVYQGPKECKVVAP